MKIDSVYRKTRTGLTVEFRSAVPEEAQLEIDYLKRVCDETPFLLTEGADVSYTVESEREFLANFESSDKELMLNAYVNGEFVGNGAINTVGSAKRQQHRANLGIAIFKEYCGIGIGEELMKLLLEQARKCGYEIVELDVYAGNVRAIHLYEKLGFEQCGRLRCAIKYKDGSYDDLILMQRFLV